MAAAASRASFSNSRPIVGRRNCRNWALSNSFVASAIGRFLSETRLRGSDQAKIDADGAVGGGAAQELIEAAEVGERDVDSRRGGLVRQASPRIAFRGLDRGQRSRPLDHGLGTVEMIALAGFDRLAHARHRMLAQQLQDLHEPARAAHRAVDPFQFGAQLGEARGELPVAEDRANGPARRACVPRVAR